MPPTRLLLSCEHGGNRIPARYRSCFRGHEAVLDSHRGYDPGALALARNWAGKTGAPLIATTISRLLIELNRSPWHAHLYSEFTRPLPEPERRAIYERYYLPYRSAVEAHIAQAVARKSRVVHISSHSFTPELDGVQRNADAGLLYDPSHPEEKTLCHEWRRAMKLEAPQFRIRMNYPYRGNSDGFTTFLRQRFPDARYLGIELEMNQGHYFRARKDWIILRNALLTSFRQAAFTLF